MRPARGCEECRERHVKCVPGLGDGACGRCSEAGRQCHFGPRFRFKPVDHVDSPSHGARARFDLRFTPDQKWVRPPRSLNFILEDGQGLEYGIPETDEAVVSPGDPMTAFAPESSVEEIPVSTDAVPPASYSISTPASAHRSHDGRAWRLSETSHSRASDVSHGELTFPASVWELSRRHEDIADADAPPPDMSRREAGLLQHFIRQIGPWMDVCDLTNQFTHEVPRRAQARRMLLFALLAVSSRHLALLARAPEPGEAAFYHGHALRLVISALDSFPSAIGPPPRNHSPVPSRDHENLLTAIVLLRLYEELVPSTDARHHLRGLGRLLAAAPGLACAGGLAEAACWQSLRQDIAIALAGRRAPSFCLENFRGSRAVVAEDDDDDDAACANGIVWLFARVLRWWYPGEGEDAAEGGERAVWGELQVEVEAWDLRRRRLFRPVYDEPADVGAGRPFPVVQLVTPPQVAALQYYHACRAFLTLHGPSDPGLTGFSAAKRRRAVEREVALEVGAIVGLARSNPFVENANFTALHLLRVAGYCVSHPLQRRCVLRFLRHVEDRMGWDTSTVSEQLREQWADLDDIGGSMTDDSITRSGPSSPRHPVTPSLRHAPICHAKRDSRRFEQCLGPDRP